MQTQSCYTPLAMVASSLVRPDKPQNSHSNPASTPRHRGKVSVGLHEPRCCGGVRTREDFTGADSDIILSLSDMHTHISRLASTPCQRRDLSQGAGNPKSTHINIVAPPRLRDSNKVGSSISLTATTLIPIPTQCHGDNSSQKLQHTGTCTKPRITQGGFALLSGL